MTVRIVDVREVTKPISSPIRNAYIDFTKMTSSLVAVITNVERNGRPVVGYGFNSNGRYGQGGLIRERFRGRLLEADPVQLRIVTSNCGTRVEHLDAERAQELFAELAPYGVRHDDPDVRNVTYRQSDGRFCVIDFELATLLPGFEPAVP